MIDNNAQLVCTVRESAEPIGYLVIDSFIRGRSFGGVRMMPDIDEAEVRDLARAMTLKYGFLGVALGGAKAGVRGDPESSQQERSVLKRLTRARWALHRRGWLPRRLTATMMLDRLSKSLAW